MIRFALIGAGRIAKKYVDIFNRDDFVKGEMVCICDISVGKAQRLASLIKIPYYDDMHTMLTAHKSDIDVIIILTESGNHAQHVLDVSRYGKHIIVEKPMALTIDDAQKMIIECDNNNIKLFVVKQNRFNLPVQKLRNVFEKNAFGKINLGTVRVRWCRDQNYYDQDPWRGTWALDGGVFSNQASHHIDLLCWFLGEPISVFAKAKTELVDIEAEDTGVAVITFKNGAIGIIEATTATRPSDLEGSLSLLGEKGTVEISGFAVNKLKHWNFIDKEFMELDLESFSENPPDVYGFGHMRYLDHIIDAIEKSKPALVDGLEAIKSLEIINAIYESIETKREVSLRFQPKKTKIGFSE